LDLDDDRFGFARIEGGHTAVEDLAAVNPNVKGGDRVYTQNCGNCVAAFEMRMRGFDVEAAGRLGMKVGEWMELFEGFQLLHLKGRTVYEIGAEFDKVASTWGDGARGTVFGKWSDSLYDEGHFFSFEVVRGKVVFVDSQYGDFDVDYLSKMLPESVKYGRIDNLRASDKIKDACLNKKRSG